MTFNYDRSVTFPGGFLANGISAGIKENGHLDFGVLASRTEANCAAVFTSNRFQAAPILVSRKNIKSSGAKIRAVVVNSGCANALTGKLGIKNAERTVLDAARRLRCRSNEVIVASTGVIGRHLPMDVIVESIPALVDGLNENSDTLFAESIITTDKFPKQVSAEVSVGGGKKFRIGGVAKGAGMIHPNMATMLCFVTTDAAVDEVPLRKSLKRGVDASFNTITVDGDTSTNDTVVVMANGASGTVIKSAAEKKFFDGLLQDVLRELATMVVRDGEGATRFVRLNVESAASYDDAVKVGRAVGTSPLVKTAIFGGDPNWGRVISAVGNSDAKFDPGKVELRIGGVCVFRKNEPQKIDLSTIQRLFSKKEIEMTIRLNAGRESANVFTCDLSYDYVKINGEYTT